MLEVGEGVGGFLGVLVGLGAGVVGLARGGARLGVDARGVVGLGGGGDRAAELERERRVGGLAMLGRLPGVAQALDLRLAVVKRGGVARDGVGAVSEGLGGAARDVGQRA